MNIHVSFSKGTSIDPGVFLEICRKYSLQIQTFRVSWNKIKEKTLALVLLVGQRDDGSPTGPFHTRPGSLPDVTRPPLITPRI